MTTLRILPLILLPLAASAVEVDLSPGADIRSLTQSLQPGDIYTFAEGTYELDAEWTVTGEATSDAPIVLRAARSTRPIIRLTTSGSRVLRIVDSSFVVVQGLTFEHDDERYEETNANGIRVENSSDVRIDDCEVRHTGGTAISLGGNNTGVSITGNHLHDTRDGHGVYAGCGDASCWLQDGVIEGNLIYDLRSPEDNMRVDGIHLAPGAQGNQLIDNIIVDIDRHGIVTQSTEYGAQNIVEGNGVWRTGQHGLWVSGAAVVRNNIAFETGGHGLYSENHRDALENLVISHNTLALTGSSALRLRGWEGRPGMVLANNAVANPLGGALHADDESLDEGIFIAGNVLTGSLDGYEPALGGVIAGGGYTDFADVEAADFYPKNNSTLRDTSDASGEAYVPSLDFSGFDRNGENPTVGALEYVNASNPGWALDRAFKEYVDNRLDNEFSQGGCCRRDGSAEAGAFLPFLLLGLLGRRRKKS